VDRTIDAVGFEALQRSIDESQAAIQDHLEEVLTRRGSSAAVVAHMRTMRLYFRVPFMLCTWVDGDRRRDVETALGEHLLAMKLLDDIVDQDSGLEHLDLLSTFFLVQNLAVRHLCELAADARAITEVLDEELAAVTTGQVWTKRDPARSLQEWRHHADSYGGRFLGLYGTLACLAGRRPEAIAAAHDFGHAFGLIITMADDWRDYERHGEVDGNLRHLVVSGQTPVEDALRDVEDLREKALLAARAGTPSDDLSSVVHSYADAVVACFQSAVVEPLRPPAG
jgi:hypothetical protein